MNLLISIIMTSMEISYKNSKEVDKMWERIALRKSKYELSSLLMKKILAVFVILDFNTSCCISLSAATPLFEYMKITGELRSFDTFFVLFLHFTTWCVLCVCMCVSVCVSVCVCALQSIMKSWKSSIRYSAR